MLLKSKETRQLVNKEDKWLQQVGVFLNDTLRRSFKQKPGRVVLIENPNLSDPAERPVLVLVRTSEGNHIVLNNHGLNAERRFGVNYTAHFRQQTVDEPGFVPYARTDNDPLFRRGRQDITCFCSTCEGEIPIGFTLARQFRLRYKGTTAEQLRTAMKTGHPVQAPSW